MEDIPKRQRSSKFDTRRRHIRNTKPRDVHCGAALEERKVAADKQKPEWNSLLGWQQDPVLLGFEEHQRQRSLHRRQLGLTAEVTVLSTVVISIGVDISGNPTATSTTTLPPGLPTTLITSSTSTSSPAAVSTSPNGVTSGINSTSTSNTLSTTLNSTLSSIISSLSSIASLSSLTSTPESPSTSPTTASGFGFATSTSEGFIAFTPGIASSTYPSTSDTSLSSRSSSVSSTASLPTPPSLSTSVSTPAYSSPSIVSSLSTSIPLTAPTSVSGFGFVTSTPEGFIGNTPIGPAHSFSGNGTSSTSTSSWTSSTLSRTSLSGPVTVVVASTGSRSSRTSNPTSPSRSTTRSRTSEGATSTSSHSSLTSSRTHSSSSSTSTRSSSSFLSGGGGDVTGAGTAPTSSPPAGNGTVAAGDSGSDTPPGVIAGSVVGSVAGFAFILLLLLVLLRWYKRRNRLAGGPGEAAALGGEDPFRDPEPSGGAMTERSSTLFPAAAVGFINRFARHQEPEPQPERGFQKISGRKLPSQFSPGMEAGAPQLPPGGGETGATMAGPAYLQGFQAAGAAGSGKDKDMEEETKDIVTSPTADSPIDHPTGPEDTTAEVASWYRDSSISTATAIPPGSAQMTTIPPRGSGGRGRYSSSAYSVDTSGIPVQTGTATAVQVPPPLRTDREQLMPGPQRTPTVRHAAPTFTPSSAEGAGPGTPTLGIGHGAGGAGPSTDSPPVSPTTGRGTLGRSHPSLDGSRGSRFTEGVE